MDSLVYHLRRRVLRPKMFAYLFSLTSMTQTLVTKGETRAQNGFYMLEEYSEDSLCIASNGSLVIVDHHEQEGQSDEGQGDETNQSSEEVPEGVGYNRSTDESSTIKPSDMKYDRDPEVQNPATDNTQTGTSCSVSLEAVGDSKPFEGKDSIPPSSIDIKMVNPIENDEVKDDDDDDDAIEITLELDPDCPWKIRIDLVRIGGDFILEPEALVDIQHLRCQMAIRETGSYDCDRTRNFEYRPSMLSNRLY